MNKRDFLIAAAAMFGLCTGGVMAEPSKNFKVFLCFGQSNMSGGEGVTPDADSKKINPRIKVLPFADCSNPTRTKNVWSDASESMHCGDGMNAMGPSFAFGQALIDSLKPTDTIGLIPCGLWAVGIEMFVKGGNYTGQYKPSGFGNNAWDWMLTKCKEATKRGVFSGIILLQGESNSGQKTWPSQVKKIYNDLKSESIFTTDIPLVAGELLQASGACCAGHNAIIDDSIPKILPFGYVASSKGLAGGGTSPQYHFNQAGYRTMGQRMAVEMMKGLRASGQMTSVSYPSSKNALTINSLQKSTITSLHTIDGKKIPAGSMQNLATGKKHCIYVMQTPGKQASLVVKPE